jgi:hypothetical protein
LHYKATSELYTSLVVGSVRCVYETGHFLRDVGRHPTAGSEVAWMADASVDPVDAANGVADDVAHWLGEGFQLLSA